MSEQTAIQFSKVQAAFHAARQKSVPLIMVRTADTPGTVKALEQVSVDDQKNPKPAPILEWDAVRGFVGKNELGTAAIAQQLQGKKCMNPVEALEKALVLPKCAVILFRMPLPDTLFRADTVVTAIQNLRNPFKSDFRTLVMLVPTGGVPTALEHDVVVIDEPLPGPVELATQVRKMYTLAKKYEPTIKDPTDAEVKRAVDGVAGLSMFAAEQALAMSLRKNGIDHAALRDKHRQMIENAKGLHVWKGGETFNDLGGLSNFKKFAQRVIGGTYQFGCVFWIDEIEKAFGGLRGDLTGISQDYLGVLLSYMQDHGVPGILLMGHPGTGKSALAKAFGNTAGVPTIRADLQAMHGSLVGESQHALRHALKIVSAVSQDHPLFIATSNSTAILPPEFINRFKWRFFVDLPDDAEKAVIWPIHLKNHKLDEKQKRPNDANWNGREIEQCCATAAQLRCSLLEAATYVVPIATSSGEEIEKRRYEADGRYLSASDEGPYSHDTTGKVNIGGKERTINFNDAALLVPGPKDAQ